METPVYRKATGAEGDTETRAQRGRRLYLERGAEIVFYIDGTFGVPSAGEAGVLRTVDLDAEHTSARCECPDASLRGAVCAHQHAAEWKRREWRREARARTIRARVKPEDRIRFTPEQILANLERMGA